MKRIVPILLIAGLLASARASVSVVPGKVSALNAESGNLAGGAAQNVPFQSAADTTAFDNNQFMWDSTNHSLGLRNAPNSGYPLAVTGQILATTGFNTGAGSNVMSFTASGGTTNFFGMGLVNGTTLGLAWASSQVMTHPLIRLDDSGNVKLGDGGTVSTFTSVGALNMASGTSITLAGAGGNLISGSSGTFNILQQQEVLNCTTGLKSGVTGVITGCVASDLRLKKDIQDLKPSDLGIIDGLRPVTYRWKDKKEDQQVHVGFIAQEVEKVLPQAVVPAGNGMKGVDPNAINAAIILELQQLRKRVALLERDKRRLR